MTNKKNTKRALILSVFALVLCVSMLVGSTYAWFTDTATTGVSTIQAGTLKVDLVDANDATLVGQSLTFQKAAGAENEPILWEPGCKYELAPVYVKNNGSLALKYQIIVNGLDGDAELLNVIDFKVMMNNGEVDLDTFEGKLAADQKSAAITLVGEMSKDAGNEYQGKTLSGLSITVVATQDTVESDSYDNQYDAGATYPNTVANAVGLAASLSNGGNVIVVGDIDISANEDVVVADGTVLDLGGNTLDASWIDAEGDMTIQNGKIDLNKDSSDDDVYIYAQTGQNVTLEDVTISDTALSVYSYKGGVLTLTDVVLVNTAQSNPVQNYGGELVLNNVTVKQEGDANSAWYSSAVQVVNTIVKNTDANKWQVVSQAETVVNGGSYTGKRAIQVNAPGGNVTVNDGVFTGSEYALKAEFAPNNYLDGANFESVIIINGGTFDGAIKVSDATELVINGGTFINSGLTETQIGVYVADGCTVTVNADGSYTVQ